MYMYVYNDIYIYVYYITSDRMDGIHNGRKVDWMDWIGSWVKRVPQGVTQM